LQEKICNYRTMKWYPFRVRKFQKLPIKLILKDNRWFFK